jgi:hypothetical protein
MTDDDTIEAEAVEVAPLPATTPPKSQSTALVARDDITVKELIAQSHIIEEAMRSAMKENVHYGRIPGVDKPTLLKPGAEKLCVLFRLAPSYDSEKIWHDDGHLTVMVRCALTHIPTGFRVAEGEGLCTTRESRYAWRKGGRVCPECNQPAIIKGKAEYGGGWLCYRKKDGCGAKWDDGSEQANEFEAMSIDRVANPDLPDSYNTVLKMGDKRALLAAVLNGTAASDVFTQDMEGSSDVVTQVSPSPSREFDPGSDLLPGAIKGKTAKETIDRLTEAMHGIDPNIDWPAITEQIPGDRDAAFLRRLSNAIEKIRQEGEGEDFGGVSDDVIVNAFAWAFQGVAVTVSLIDDVPFG